MLPRPDTNTIITTAQLGITDQRCGWISLAVIGSETFPVDYPVAVLVSVYEKKKTSLSQWKGWIEGQIGKTQHKRDQ